MPDGCALVLLAKWPGSGASKTRLTGQLAAASAGPPDEARRWVAAFSRAALTDLICRFGNASIEREGRKWQCVLLYSPPVDEARQYFATILEEAGMADTCAPLWRLMPVLSTSEARSANLGDILTDAARRARAACGVGRVAFLGADCPELPIHSVAQATSAASEPRVASICPATDGGYTLLALPEEADVARCFKDVRWSQSDTCISQLAALSSAGLLCNVGETHSDVDDLDDLRALAVRLSASGGSGAAEGGSAVVSRADPCPRTAALLAEMTAAGLLNPPGERPRFAVKMFRRVDRG